MIESPFLLKKFLAMAEAIRPAFTFDLLWCRWKEQTYLALPREDAEWIAKIEKLLNR